MQETLAEANLSAPTNSAPYAAPNTATDAATSETVMPPCAPISAAATALAARHLGDVIGIAIEYTPQQQAVVVSDARCPLAATLTAAYRSCLPGALFIDFDSVAPAQILSTLTALKPGDLVVLVQSSSFRLDAYRLRVELFKLSLKVIEHAHLGRMPGAESLCYIDGLAYDPAYYRVIGPALKQRIDAANSAVVDSGGALLRFDSPLESAKINIGDYRDMHNVGGQFPIGEVFTEAQNLEAVHGRVRIFVFGDTEFCVNKPAQPITLVIEAGRVIEVIDSTPEFDAVLALIRAAEGEIWLRELGFGMNRAFSRDQLVRDIGTYERMCGIHLSLGAKHGVYNKPGFKRRDTRFHVDVFAVTEAVFLDNEQVYRDGAWQVESQPA